LLVVCVSLGSLLQAAENGRSTYAASSAADFGTGFVPPKVGLILRTELSYYDGDLSEQLLGGAVDVDANLTAWVLTARFLWTTGLELFGGRHGVYVSIPFAAAESTSTITQQVPGGQPVTLSNRETETNIGDIYVTPLALSWQLGDWQIKWQETVIIPPGSYDSDNTLNISRNHFAFLSALGGTYRRGQEGAEINLRGGYIFNTENRDTKYTTGDEVFVDGSLSWRFKPTFTVGLTGYAYQQVTGDRGEGAIFGDLKGRVFALGPVVRTVFSVRDHLFIGIAKWLHEFESENRFEGDLFMLSIVTSL
jgi:hypothetical protein